MNDTPSITPPAGPPAETFASPRQLQVVTAAFLALHVYHAAIQGGGGWYRRHNGLLGAIWQFFRLNAGDPVLSAGQSDFAMLAVLFAGNGLRTLPPDLRWTWRTKVWLTIYTLFPGLGALLLPLWLRPAVTRAAHRAARPETV